MSHCFDMSVDVQCLPEPRAFMERHCHFSSSFAEVAAFPNPAACIHVKALEFGLSLHRLCLYTAALAEQQRQRTLLRKECEQPPGHPKVWVLRQRCQTSPETVFNPQIHSGSSKGLLLPQSWVVWQIQL